MQCSAEHQAVRHYTEGTGGAARNAGCSWQMRPCVTARRRRQGNVGQVRECTGPAMPQHTYTQRAHNTHSPARLPVPVGRHPGLLPFGNSAFGTTQHGQARRSTGKRGTAHHGTPQNTTTARPGTLTRGLTPASRHRARKKPHQLAAHRQAATARPATTTAANPHKPPPES